MWGGDALRESHLGVGKAACCVVGDEVGVVLCNLTDVVPRRPAAVVIPHQCLVPHLAATSERVRVKMCEKVFACVWVSE